jgi:cobalamin-dependent methionine synthase I
MKNILSKLNELATKIEKTSSKRIPVYLSQEELKLIKQGLDKVQGSGVLKLIERVEAELDTFEE